jgi:hypothetical protein
MSEREGEEQTEMPEVQNQVKGLWKGIYYLSDVNYLMKLSRTKEIVNVSRMKRCFQKTAL